jgi:hypothetical protein
MKRAVAISLKIPDNTAYTAGVALRRLGLDVQRVERSEIRLFDEGGDGRALIERIKADETIFNPNKHVVTLLDRAAPRSGEIWIERLEPSDLCLAVAWRLFDAHDAPCDRVALRAAAERLLCNPAIERALY